MIYYNNNTELPPNCSISIKDKDKKKVCDNSGCKERKQAITQGVKKESKK